MLNYNSGPGRSWSRGGGRSGNLPSLQVQFRECSREACKSRGYCEFRLMKQEYGGLLQRSSRSHWVGRNRSNKSATRQQALDDPRVFIKEFFGRYERQQIEYPNRPRFQYNYWEPVIYEFYRMCRTFNWRKPEKNEEPNPDFIKAREGFRDALALQFNALYGTDEDDLTSWQNLCCVLNIPKAPEELEACMNLVASMHVNIIDLIDTPVTQEPTVHFKSEEHPSIYTLHTGKKFPIDNVNSGDLLRFLLRKIDAYDFHPNPIWGHDLLDSLLKRCSIDES
ncbi:hypothetical protein B0J17DRAFT_634014 [Rhizoctonia solani]|nr:hypothetical protein B0J17DRAFT_634014 [Rhizoctonia solani]